MALTNCSINSASLIKTGGQAIGSQNATLTITPNAGFVVEATDFSVSNVTYASNGNSLTWAHGQNGVSLPTGVTSITLANSTSANAVDNTITVTIDLTDSYSMPSANTTLTIDIDGAASLIQYTLSGQLSSQVSNTDQSAETNVAYSATNTTGQTSQVFQRTFKASTNYHFEVEPYFELTADNPSRYSITSQKTYLNGRLDQIVFTVNYTFSSESETGDTILFVANAVEFFTQTVEIYSYNIIDSVISQNGTTREINILGTPTAQVKLSVSNLAGNTYNFSSDTFTSSATDLEITIPNSGRYTDSIAFPEVSSADTYTISLNTTTYSNGINSNIDTNTDGIVSFTLSQPTNITITVRPTHGDGRILISEDKTTELLSGTNATGSEAGNLNHIFEISTVDGPLRILSQPSASSFTNTASGSNNGTTINITSVVLLKEEDKLFLSIEGSIGVVGTANVISGLDLSNNLRIQNKTKAFSDVFDCSRGGSVVLSLRSTDADGDTMTHALVDTTNFPQNGTLGSLTTNSSTAGPPSELLSDVTYTHSGNDISADYVKFKANDGVDDSEVKTITINITNSAPVATDQPTGISCEKGGIVTGNLSVTDADNALSELTYTLITEPSQGKVTFNQKGGFKYAHLGDLPASVDQFTYEVSDGIESDQATVTVNITSQPDANDLTRPCVQNQSTGLIILEGSSPTNTAITYSLTTAPTRGSLFYNSALNNPSGGIPTGNLSASQVYYKNNGVSATNDEFKYRVTDSNGSASRIATVEIPVSAPPAPILFYQSDDDQSGTGASFVSAAASIGASGNTRTLTFTYSGGWSIVTGETNQTVRLQFRRNSGPAEFQVSMVLVKLWATHQRVYNEVTTGNTNPIRISYTPPAGAVTSSGSYQIIGNSMVIPNPGTYFATFSYTLIIPAFSSGNINAGFKLDAI